MQPYRNVHALVFTFALAATGCAAKKPVPQAAPPPPLPPEGKSSYSFIFDPANPALGLPEDVQFIRPMARETTTLPIYPESALAAHDARHREVVRIVIDDHGSVSRVEDSPMESSDGGPYAADYRHAVDVAVRTWRFEPGRFQHVVNGPDKDADGKPDYKVMKSGEVVAVYYDIRFTFEIVDGKGVVKASP
jgi:hypothetical protein